MTSVLEKQHVSAVVATTMLGPSGRRLVVADIEKTVEAPAAGKPIMLRLDQIDEDPSQPRSKDNPGFSPRSLAELAAAIALRGVKTPISVRTNHATPGRFLINHGARRYRASRIAGLDYIPGFIDENYEQADQVIENLHRNELTAREVADYIGRELAKGLRKADIAKQISKSAAFITQHATLLDLPDAIATAFNSGRIRDVTLVNELVKVHRNAPSELVSWLADEQQDISRHSVKLLRDFISSKSMRNDEIVPVGRSAPVLVLGGANEHAREGREKQAQLPWQSPVLFVRHAGREARLLMRRRPGRSGSAWIRYNDDCTLAEVALSDVQLLALLDESGTVDT